ncbi:gamma-aminobutyric acid receptor alpha-like [Eriocheir sinensis]|uniref:gamma-aminobutyric acid receptor alpha-like n=1 Tax=Eriocheir sinensis TaxID=95602 RepID=UPI0021C98963|nr:gamma-aminobutyric acid receptor alpha-like [Eriocheir sinensis]
MMCCWTVMFPPPGHSSSSSSSSSSPSSSSFSFLLLLLLQFFLLPSFLLFGVTRANAGSARVLVNGERPGERNATPHAPAPHAYPRINRQLPSFSYRTGSLRQITPGAHISRVLDNLLLGYDQKLRPSFGGEPTTVEIDIEVRSMSQISEMDMTYSMDCYFRQSWVDERLAFSGVDAAAISLSVSALDKLWKPDTFFHNGKRSYVHLITTPNKFIRLAKTGRILYSSRLGLKLHCILEVRSYPVSVSLCPVSLFLFAYTTRDVLYRWNKARQVVTAPDLMLSQFDLIATPSGFENTTRRTGEFSTLLASFHLQRHMGNFLITVYGPCVLLVVLSWVSFWLNREATSDRISLGITTVLTMTFLGLEARTDLPKVPYSTALDLFVWISYGFIFATIIEFAFVHLFTKVGSGEVYLSYCSSEDDDEEDEDDEDDDHDEDQDEEEEEKEEEEEEEEEEVVLGVGDTTQEEGKGNEHQGREMQQTPVKNASVCLATMRGVAVLPLAPYAMGPNGVGSSRLRSPKPGGPRCSSSVVRRLTGLCGRRKRRQVLGHFSKERRQEERSSAGSLEDWRREREREGSKAGCGVAKFQLQANSVSSIDKVSRVLFPLAFLAINLVYWLTFLSHDPWPSSHL